MGQARKTLEAMQIALRSGEGFLFLAVFWWGKLIFFPTPLRPQRHFVENAMKKLCGLLLFLALAAPAWPQAQQKQDQRFAHSLKPNVNIRQRPDVWHKTIGKLQAADRVEVLDEANPTAGFYHIKKDGLIGWVATWLLEIENKASEKTFILMPCWLLLFEAFLTILLFLYIRFIIAQPTGKADEDSRKMYFETFKTIVAAAGLAIPIITSSLHSSDAPLNPAIEALRYAAVLLLAAAVFALMVLLEMSRLYEKSRSRSSDISIPDAKAFTNPGLTRPELVRLGFLSWLALSSFSSGLLFVVRYIIAS